MICTVNKGVGFQERDSLHMNMPSKLTCMLNMSNVSLYITHIRAMHSPREGFFDPARGNLGTGLLNPSRFST